MSATTSPQTPVSTGSGTTAPRYPLGWLRAVAALVVVIFHAYQHNRSGADSQWPWSGTAHTLMLGSDAFVDMFFVLSGLVIWLPVVRSAARGAVDSSGRMLLLRRVARLLPLYYLVVLVVWALSNPVFPGQHWGDLLLHLSFLHVYSDTYVFWTDGPAWSLAVEFHFYVVMALAVPLVRAGVRRARCRRGRLLVTAALPALAVLAGLAYLAWATLLSPQDPENWSIWFSPLSRAADFGLGMGLAVLSAGGVRLPAPVRATLSGVGTAALLALVVARPTTGIMLEWWHPAYSLVICVALAGIVLADGPWPAWMSWRPLAWLGGLGYGIYLIHEPVMRLLDGWGLLPEARPGWFFVVTAVLVAVPTVLLAWLSSNTVEMIGVRLLGTMDRQGRSRDYYAHTAQHAAGR